ncbi:HTTM domain-containing protein [Streptomyces sp. 35G-GA-8]|uniref:HTTM domain-containing protein n=1 Tax=Streptomyces sp. 35G-GA-8 TaxID=2939434 RepID=UPI00201F7388|nr:HTTM domain-containing protein [Streptomyces sp. 35G-GA-8]MCL7379465.1 HTTM domain-containing protein [Streptomyces sp. 35G-GA-8]
MTGKRVTFDRWVAGGIQRVTARPLGRYQSAVVRIGFAGTWLLFLVRELPHRREMYGPDAPWGWEIAQQLIAKNGAFTGLMWSDSTVWFEIVFAIAMLSSALLMVGWRTRTMSVVFMFGVLSLQNRSIFMGDGGDNIIHLIAIYLVLTRCGQVWSLDARRARRAARKATGAAPDGAAPDGVAPESAVPDSVRPDRAVPDRVGPVLWVVLGGLLVVGTSLDRVHVELWMLILFWGLWAAQGLWWAANRYAPDGEPRALLDVVANLVHNAGLAVIMAEVCLVYATAGWYKIQGSRWQDGTALYYPLKLDYFSPLPDLSGLLATSGVMVMLLSYGTVIVQVAFPFTLFNRRVKNVLLVAMMLEHAGIAVLLGLPFFSLAMIAADAVFLPTNFLRWLGGRVSGLWGRFFLRTGNPLPEQRSESPDQPRTLVG